MYNVWDLFGRYIPLLKFLKLESRKGLMVAILSRFLLVPAFYFTAKYGDEGWMIMLTSLLGLTNGYLTVCVLTSAPKGYKVCSFVHNTSNVTLLFFICFGVDFMNLSTCIGFWNFVGTRAKCLGKSAGIFFTGRHICRGNAWLVVVNRQGLVTIFIHYSLQFDIIQ